MKLGDIVVPEAGTAPFVSSPAPRGSGIVVSIKPFVLAYEEGGRILFGLNRQDFRSEGPADTQTAVAALSGYISMLSDESQPYFVEHWAEKAFNEIDAGFSSDYTFYSVRALARCEFFLGRWQRRIAEIKKFLVEYE